MSSSDTVALTAACEPAPTGGEILFPQQGPSSDGSYVVAEAKDGTEKVLKVGRRRDGGLGACVSASVLAALGGEGTEISYRDIKTGERVMRDRKLFLKVVLSTLALVVAILAAVGAYFAAKDKVGWPGEVALLILCIAIFAAFLKFISDLLDL